MIGGYSPFTLILLNSRLGDTICICYSVIRDA